MSEALFPPKECQPCSTSNRASMLIPPCFRASATRSSPRPGRCWGPPLRWPSAASMLPPTLPASRFSPSGAATANSAPFATSAATAVRNCWRRGLAAAPPSAAPITNGSSRTTGTSSTRHGSVRNRASSQKTGRWSQFTLPHGVACFSLPSIRRMISSRNWVTWSPNSPMNRLKPTSRFAPKR